MTSNIQIETYAQQLSGMLRDIAIAQDAAKDLIASAKDAGVNVKALRKVAREMCMETGKREKLYEDEAQIDMFRHVMKLTSPALKVAAE